MKYTPTQQDMDLHGALKEWHVKAVMATLRLGVFKDIGLYIILLDDLLGQIVDLQASRILGSKPSGHTLTHMVGLSLHLSSNMQRSCQKRLCKLTEMTDPLRCPSVLPSQQP